jgi:hypothetical protein
MAADPSDITKLALPRIGAAIIGTALVFPALTLPLTVACLVALGNLALKESRADNRVPELPSGGEPQERVRPASLSESESEDSFPASDPPSWTPVTGTGTRH